MKRNVLLTVTGIVCSLLLGCSETTDTVTFRVEPREFVHRVVAEGLLTAAVTTEVNVPRTIDAKVRIAWLAEDASRVEADQVVARFDALEFEERRANRRDELSQNDLQIEQAETEGEGRLAEVDKNFEVAGLELDVASRYQLTDEDVFSRIELLESQLDAALAEDRRDSAQRVRPVERDLADAQKELLLVARRKVQIELDKAQRGLSALEVRAPHSGIFEVERVRGGDPLAVGELAWPGRKLGSIPDLGRMEAQIWVLEADAGGLEVGKPATLRLASSPGLEISASIKKVDPVSQRRERGSSLQYFGVTLSILDPPESLKPGLRVEATLELARLEEALVLPRQAVFLRDGAPHVWRQSGSGFEAQPVTLGVQTAGRTVIESGLETGDLIALEAPPEATEETPDVAPPQDVGSDS